MRGPLRVLVVGEWVEGAVGQTLSEAGFEAACEAVADEPAFIAALARPGWDLVLARHPSLPLSAPRVLELVAGDHAELPVVVVADAPPDPEAEDLVALMRAGARDCLLPHALGELGRVVARELGRSVERRARAEAERRRRAELEHYRALVEEIPALTYVARPDAMASRSYLSPQLESMLGFVPADWLAASDAWARQIHPEDRERVLAEFRRCCAEGAPFACEYRMLDRDGREVWWRDEGRVLRDERGRPRFVRGFAQDVTERRLAEQALRHLRHYDQLTGLPNRVLLAERLGRALGDGTGQARPLALLMLSLDRFREVNATFGHHNGDLVIKEVATRLCDVLGGAEWAARLRGDEFAALLPGADAALAEHVAAKVLKALERPFIVEKLPIEVGASLGICVAPQHGQEAELLLRRGDMAVQAARRAGGGCLTYSERCDPYDPDRLALLGELRRGLEAGQLLLHYQPKVDLETRSVIGVEALLRWRRPRHGLVPPGQFIPLAEQGGLIKPLTRWVLGEALNQCRTWEHAGRPMPVAVNLSARDLQDPHLVDGLSELLAARGLPPQRLQLELTESAMMADPAHAADVLCALDERGVRLSIDDFGTGYSSLAYLGKLPVSELKIDRSFVMGMATHGSKDTTIVRSTAQLGHHLGLKVVAEGVENGDVLERLHNLGCDAAQGYYIAHPMSADDLGGWLAQSRWRASAN